MNSKECDEAYSKEVLMVGHKSYLVKLLGQEIEEHLVKCRDLSEKKTEALEKEKEQNVSSPVSE